MELLDLPIELLTTICGRLDWVDMLRVRRTCKVLKKVSNTREAWAAILSRYILSGRIPRPFFLPKPLSDCSSYDLERSVKTWESPWPEIVPTMLAQATIDVSGTTERQRFTLREGMRTGMRLLPGGRWVLVSSDAGSISYLDLRDLRRSQSPACLTLKPLIAPVCDYPEFFTVGWTSFDIDTMLGGTLENHHLTTFRIAVAVSYRPQVWNGGLGGHTINRMTVWRVQVGRNDLQVERRLCVFEEPLIRSSGWGCICLMGDHVAYVRHASENDTTQCISVTQWAKPSSETKEAIQSSPVRWLLPMPANEVLRILLLPWDKLLVSLDTSDVPNVSYSVMHLYNWRLGTQDGSSSGPEVPDEADPLWVSEELGGPNFQWNASLLFPSFMPDDEVRLVGRSPDGIYGFRILPHSSPHLGAVSVECLKEDKTKNGDWLEMPLCNHTISFQKREVHSYRWQGGDDGRRALARSSRFHIDSPSVLNNALAFTKIVYDPFAHRFVYLSDSKDLTIRILDLLVP